MNKRRMKMVKKVKACGIILFSKKAKRFLLLKHPDRYDLPKGHVHQDETDLECALREFVEETGIDISNIILDKEFKYSEKYFPKSKKYNYEEVEKTIIIYLAYLKKGRKKQPLLLTEHDGYEWKKWNPPHNIQNLTIDPLLNSVEKYFERQI